MTRDQATLSDARRQRENEQKEEAPRGHHPVVAVEQCGNTIMLTFPS